MDLFATILPQRHLKMLYLNVPYCLSGNLWSYCNCPSVWGYRRMTCFYLDYSLWRLVLGVTTKTNLYRVYNMDHINYSQFKSAVYAVYFKIWAKLWNPETLFTFPKNKLKLYIWDQFSLTLPTFFSERKKNRKSEETLNKKLARN